VKCDHCGKFCKPEDLTRDPVTQADYLFGDPGPFYTCAGCLPIHKQQEADRG
jgi:hypothetical protein